MASKLVAIRRRVPGWIPDPPNPHLTIVGSNGVGCFEPGQSLAVLRRKIARIAADFAPIRVRLGKVERFPNSDIFAFGLRSDSELRRLHERIVNCGLSFQPSPWTFAPHVTVSQRSSISEEQAAGLYTLCVADAFMLDAISIYHETAAAAGERCFQLLSRIPLGSAPQQPAIKSHA